MITHHWLTFIHTQTQISLSIYLLSIYLSLYRYIYISCIHMYIYIYICIHEGKTHILAFNFLWRSDRPLLWVSCFHTQLLGRLKILVKHVLINVEQLLLLKKICPILLFPEMFRHFGRSLSPSHRYVNLSRWPVFIYLLN